MHFQLMMGLYPVISRETPVYVDELGSKREIVFSLGEKAYKALGQTLTYQWES